MKITAKQKKKQIWKLTVVPSGRIILIASYNTHLLLVSKCLHWSITSIKYIWAI